MSLDLYFDIFTKLIDSLHKYTDSFCKFDSMKKIFVKTFSSHFYSKINIEEFRTIIQTHKYICNDSDDEHISLFVDEIYKNYNWNIFENDEIKTIEDEFFRTFFLFRNKIFILRLFSNLELLFKMFLKFIEQMNISSFFEKFMNSIQTILEIILNVYSIYKGICN